MEFRELETFVWVATLGSFRRAAAKLNTTQPAVSQRIARLEAEFGRPLLVREKRAVRPTETGRRLFDHAERLLRLRTEALMALADPAAVTGTLRLGVAESIVHTWLPRFIERMSATHPGLALEIDVDISPNLRARLMAQEIDLAFLVGPLTAPQLANAVLCRFPVAFVASPALGLGGRRIPAAELARHAVVTFARNTQPHTAVRAAFAADDPAALRIHASASVATIVRMTLDGLGVAAIPPAIVADQIATGALHRVDTAVALPDLVFAAAWRIGPQAAMLATVADLARAVAGGELAPPQPR